MLYLAVLLNSLINAQNTMNALNWVVVFKRSARSHETKKKTAIKNLAVRILVNHAAKCVFLYLFQQLMIVLEKELSM